MANEKYFTAKIILAINRKCAISENVGGGGGVGEGSEPLPWIRHWEWSRRQSRVWFQTITLTTSSLYS